MGTKMNKKSYQKLIDENLEWLNKQPKTLERMHIADIVKESIDFYYPKQVDNLPISSVVDSAVLNKDKGHGICKEDGCEKFAVIDYNGHGHWNCQSCYDSNERYFEAEYS